jgi:hypothetical protein
MYGLFKNFGLPKGVALLARQDTRVFYKYNYMGFFKKTNFLHKKDYYSISHN